MRLVDDRSGGRLHAEAAGDRRRHGLDLNAIHPRVTRELMKSSSARVAVILELLAIAVGTFA